jgi:ABC-type nitrate/sulfonate/bicarbonate transport system permease component
MREILRPFGEVSRGTKIGLSIFWAVLFIGLFEFYHSSVFPAPSKIVDSLVGFIQSSEFYEDLGASTLLTFKAMGISILLTVVIVYLSRLPLFDPLADFVSKCRYLTLTGLVFVFTMTSDNISQLKMTLLVFGITPFFVTSFLSIVRATPIQEIQKGYVNRLNRWETLYEVVVVGKLDQLFEVMRQNFAISWMMITMVEGYAMAEGGIGTMMIKSNKYLNLAPVFAMLIIVLLLGLCFDYLLSYARKAFFPYLKTR